MFKKIVFSFLFIVTASVFGQKNINNYKYIIVPDRFEFVKNTDQYQTSSLTKFLLKKKGFNVFLSNEKLPNDLIRNRCLALTASVNDDSSMFTVKQNIEFKDCFGNVLYTSKIGKSKHKEYKKAYHEAIRRAYESMSDLEYTYQPIKEATSVVKKPKTDVTIPVMKDTQLNVVTPKTKKVVTVDRTTKTNQNLSIKTETLYAQSIDNGYQLVNTKPEIVFQILKTKMPNVYIIKEKNGILYKSNTSWIAEFYEGDKLLVKRYSIKF